jgi:hypothetical protein
MSAVSIATGATETTERAQLAKEFPSWHIWNSRTGRWWATRRGNLRFSREHDPGWSMTVDGDTSEELRGSLQSQEAMT